MEPASPARLFAAAAGVLLIVLGVLGFFYDASFGPVDRYEEALGAVEVNGWINLFYVGTGSLGLYLAGVASRAYALTVGILFVALGIIGWGSDWVQYLVGVLGLAAAAGTPKRGSKVDRSPTEEPRKSKARAKPARQRA